MENLLRPGTRLRSGLRMTNRTVGEVFQARREHAEAAIAAAVKAFGTTRRLPAFERQRVLRQVAATITARKEEFARTMAHGVGQAFESGAD